MARPDRVYVSVLAWPAGLDEARRRDICQKYLGADAFRAREWARRSVPAIFCRDRIEHADRVVRELREIGVIAMATPGDLLGRGAPASPVAEWLERCDGGALYRADVVRGPGTHEVSFRPRRLIALVRAHAREAERSAHGDIGAAVHQLQGTMSAQDWVESRVTRARVSIVEVVDIATLDGLRLRVIGGRCDLRGIRRPAGVPSARAAMDALAETLRSDAGNGVDIDTGFESARFLAQFTPDFDISGDWRSLAGFDVYSNWVYQVARMRADA